MLHMGRFVNRFGKKNCRESTKTTYAGHYRRVQKVLGWRKNSKKILVDSQCNIVALDKAIDSDLLIKNAAKQVNTVISKEEKKERQVLTVSEAELFLSKATDTLFEAMELMERVNTILSVHGWCGKCIVHTKSPHESVQ